MFTYAVVILTPFQNSIICPFPGFCQTMGIAMLFCIGEYRDADTIKASAQGDCALLTSTCCTTGKGREVPQAGSAWR